jgi:hypothetical protein
MHLGSLITTIRSTFRLFRQPHKIGDVIEVGGKSLLILGIERFNLLGHLLEIWYTCQDLSQSDYVTLKKAYQEPHMVELEIQVKHDDERLKRFLLGTVWKAIDHNMYKVTEYTEIKVVTTDIYISMAARPIYPIDRKEAKAKLFSEKRKKINLELV